MVIYIQSQWEGARLLGLAKPVLLVLHTPIFDFKQ